MGALGLPVLLSIGLWSLTHRPGLTLATIAVLNLWLALAAPDDPYGVVINAGLGGAADPEFGLALTWLAGAVALMFAFDGANKPLIARMPTPRSRQTLLRTAVIVEGAVAVMWPPIAYLTLGMDLDVSAMTHAGIGTWIFGASLGLVFVAWFAANVAIRSGWGRARLSR
ncbi:hypothetical protein [Actinomadura welshii]|uniref:hypothetical protein n=1 Tax=Actinomadura welshii TaxID=3103817 RepID=UPI0003AD20F7|nr:hypothetical protein [Actinomadura madurae]